MCEIESFVHFFRQSLQFNIIFSTDYGSLEVQVRTELVSNTSNDSTIFVGIAAKVSGFLYFP